MSISITLGCVSLLNSSSKIYQAWGAGRSITSTEDKKEVRAQVEHDGNVLTFHPRSRRRRKKAGYTKQCLTDEPS